MILCFLAVIFLILATVYSALVSFRQNTEDEAHSWIFPDGNRRSARIVAGISTLILMIGCMVWFHMSVRDTTRRSLRVLIPEGYSGWVRVEFDVPGEAHLPSESRQTVLKIPSTGLLKTSSPEQFGWAKDFYEFYSTRGRRVLPDSGAGRLIWGKLNGESSSSHGKGQYEEFFVSTGEQYRDQMNRATPPSEPQDIGKDDRPKSRP